jgi:hypothetical protein
MIFYAKSIKDGLPLMGDGCREGSSQPPEPGRRACRPARMGAGPQSQKPGGLLSRVCPTPGCRTAVLVGRARFAERAARTRRDAETEAVRFRGASVRLSPPPGRPRPAQRQPGCPGQRPGPEQGAEPAPIECERHETLPGGYCLYTNDAGAGWRGLSNYLRGVLWAIRSVGLRGRAWLGQVRMIFYSNPLRASRRVSTLLHP